MQIKDEKQALLVSLPKDKDKRGGKNEPIYLIPEFCVITGLSLLFSDNFKA